MHFNRLFLFVVFAGLLTACGGSSKSSTPAASIPASTAASTANSKAASSLVANSTATMSSAVATSSAASVSFSKAFAITGAMGAGWNLGNSLDAFGGETNWGNPKTTKVMIDTLKNAGFKTLRVPVTWDDHMSGTEHTIVAAWMDRVEEIVNYGLDNNMYVIINIHHNNGWEMPTLANEANAKDYLTKMWQQIAMRFNKYDDHLIFETMNEPRVTINSVDDWVGKQEYFDVVNRLNVEALAVIRATQGNNATRLVMLPGYVAGSGDLQVNAFKLPPNDGMLAVSAHAYYPYHFALNSDVVTGTPLFTDTQDIDKLYARLNTKFISKGIPVVMGEWASTSKWTNSVKDVNNLSERVKHAEYYVKGAKKLNIPTIWWDNGNASVGTSDAMAVFNRTQNTWYFPEIRDAIMNGML
jgi:endoglucanase